MKPKIFRYPPRSDLFVCRWMQPHNLHFVVGSGSTYREAYNDWLTQLKEYC